VTSKAMLPTLILVTASACATAAPDTPGQARARAALEACNTETGGRSYDLKVEPDGRYSWRSSDSAVTQKMIECMRGKGYAPQRRP
jgi:hypothetical protein